MRIRGLSAAIFLTVLWLPLVAQDLPDDAVRQGPALGLMLEPDELESGLALAGDAPPRPLFVRLVASWSVVERTAGEFDWSTYAQAMEAARQAGLSVVLCLSGSNPLYLGPDELPSPLSGQSAEAWLAFARSAVSTFADRVGVFEIWDEPARGSPPGSGRGFEPELYAFLLKSTALAMRAEARALGRQIAISQGAVSPDDLVWQRRVWEAGSAPYVDVLPIGLTTEHRGAVAPAVAMLLAAALQHPPAPALWLHVQPARGEHDASSAALSTAVRGLITAAAVALVRPARRQPARDEQTDWLHGLQRELTRGYAPAPLGHLRLEDSSGATPPGAGVLGRFFDAQSGSTLVLYELPPGTTAEDEASLLLDSALVRDTRLLDLVSGDRTRIPSSEAGEGRRAARVRAGRYPMALAFRKAVAPGLELPPEDLEVKRRRGLTAEEIIARHQQVQRDQDLRLQRWIARGRVDFHFKFAQGGGTLDIGVEGNYFWKRDGSLEVEQTDYYINGNRVNWKKIPEIPFFQPEKVATIPLDLTLDRTYDYRLHGEGEVGDRQAYILGFEPAAGQDERSLYRGRVWIDAESFVRLRTSVVQTNLEAPVLSNEQRDDYRAVTGTDGFEYWMLSGIDGQQIWTAGGRNFVVQREQSLDEFQINPDSRQFEERLASAYASDNQILRDTADGLRYLERQPDGSRTVKAEMDTNQLFVAGGLFKDNSIDSVVPLAGVNYFDYDLFGRNVQLNVLFAGVFAFVNATKPGLFGGRADLALDAVGFALKANDEVYDGDDELLIERIDRRSQSVAARLGIPIGQFFKITLVGDLNFETFHEDDDARNALQQVNQDPATDLSFVLPPDHRVLTGRVELEFNRRGYTLSVSGGRSSRSAWRGWGLFDNNAGAFVDPQFDPDNKTYERFGMSLFKEWYLPRFQKIRGEVTVLDGRDLDRFSRYAFSQFGDTGLSGFSGSGVRFDQALIGRVGYAFNLFEVVRFSATLESARIENEFAAAGTQSFTGIGLSGNFVGPWKTVIGFSYGRALASDIQDLEGQQEYLLTVFKLF